MPSRPLASDSHDESGFKARDRLPVIALVAANLIPLVGIFLFDWDVRYLLLLYWLENLVVGAFTAIRMFSVGGIGATPMVLFFCFHYGFFCGGHGVFLLGVTSLAGSEVQEAPFQDSNLPFLIPIELLGSTLTWIKLNMPDLLFVPLIAMVLSHGVSLIKHHCLGGEDEGRNAQDIMSDPYRRIFLLHLAIIAGSFFIVSAGGGSAAPTLALLVGGKIWLDLHLHRKAHRERRRKTDAPDRADDSKRQDQGL